MNVALLSVRQRRSVPWFGGIVDAENVLVRCLDARLYQTRRLSKWPVVGRHRSLHLDRLLAETRIKRPYRHDGDDSSQADVLVVLVAGLHDCIVLLGTPRWSKLGRTVLLHVSEISARDTYVYASILWMLQRHVDHLFVSTEFVRKAVLQRGRIRTVEYIPPLLDVLAFSGDRPHSERQIDVFNPGRRNPDQHAVLTAAVAAINGRYVFDKEYLGRVDDLAAHRRWFTSAADDSRIFITNPMRFDQPSRRGPQPAAGARYYEAAAAGCCLVGSFVGEPGEAPLAGVQCVGLSMDHEPMTEELANLLADPQLSDERGRQARRIALSTHDIAHRWARMAEVAGLPPSPGIVARRRMLWQLGENLAV